jgi:hypothetical protein
MTKPVTNIFKNILTIRMMLIISLILCSWTLSAQTFTNFSGEWLQDNSKSDPQYKDYNVKLTIAQTALDITIKTAYCDKDWKEKMSSSESYTLDGKEVSKEQDGGVDVMSAKWSADKKSLTTKTSRTNEGEVYGSTCTYSLSGNGLILTVKSDNIRPGQPSIIQVLNKK